MKENGKIIKNQIQNLSKEISETYKDSLINKNKKIDQFLKNMEKIEIENKEKNELINKKIKDIEYLLEHNTLLMMKLANKGIISEREINEMNLRSNKKINRN